MYITKRARISDGSYEDIANSMMFFFFFCLDRISDDLLSEEYPPLKAMSENNPDARRRPSESF